MLSLGLGIAFSNDIRVSTDLILPVMNAASLEFQYEVGDANALGLVLVHFEHPTLEIKSNAIGLDYTSYSDEFEGFLLGFGGWVGIEETETRWYDSKHTTREELIFNLYVSTGYAWKWRSGFSLIPKGGLVYNPVAKTL